MKKAVLAALLFLVASTLTVGSAATLGVTGGSVASGAGAVVRCGDTAAATVAFTVNGLGDITATNISGLPATCNGASARAVLRAGTVTLASAGPETVTNGAATLPLSTPLLASLAAGLTETRVVLTGP